VVCAPIGVPAAELKASHAARTLFLSSMTPPRLA
jgi:hypothetical protein